MAADVHVEIQAEIDAEVHVEVQADTVIPVERGARLAVENWRGSVAVRVWDRDAVRVVGDNARALDVAIRGPVVRVRANPELPQRRPAELSVTIPRWMATSVTGLETGVVVEGSDGDVVIESMSGDVEVRGGAGDVSIHTIRGAVAVRDARGRVEVRAVNDPVTVENVTGDVAIEATNGSVDLRGIRSRSVRVRTVNGGVRYQGSILDDGRYAFTTHNGSIDLTVPASTNATVSAVTHNGNFNSEFPVHFTGMSRDRHFNFTLGSGSARLDAESFNGNIVLRRP